MKRFKELIRRLLRGPWADQRTYYTVFVAVLLVPNLFLCVTEPMPWLGKAALLLVPGGVWMGLFALARRPGLPLWCLLPVLVFGAFQLVLLYLFGNSIIAVDMLLNVATTNSGEAMELLGKLAPAIVGVVALYVPTLILGVVSARLPDRLSDAFRRRSLWRAAFVLLVGGGAMVGARIQDPAYRAKYDLWPSTSPTTSRRRSTAGSGPPVMPRPRATSGSRPGPNDPTRCAKSMSWWWARLRGRSTGSSTATTGRPPRS